MSDTMCSSDEAADQDLALIEATVLEPGLRGTEAHTMALGLLIDLIEKRQLPKSLVDRFDEILSAGFSVGPPLRFATLQVLAAALSAYGLSLGISGKGRSLGRLKPFLVLAVGELRLALEGYSSHDGLCAACAVIEATIINFGKEAKDLENSSNLEEVSSCLSELHRALHDIYEFCLDIPRDAQNPQLLELAVVARVVAVFQLEDPRRYLSEFQRSIPVFCTLPDSDFQILLPSLQETQDWHLTPAFGKILELTMSYLDAPSNKFPDANAVWRHAALMLVEIALDAAVYLPEAAVPEPPSEPQQFDTAVYSCPAFPAAVSASTMSVAVTLPRPVPAADPQYVGVKHLCGWSNCFWSAGTKHIKASDSASYWELSILCGSLLISVPKDTVYSLKCAGIAKKVWEGVATCILEASLVDPVAWRLAVRLAGFALDRHSDVSIALGHVASAKEWADKTFPAVKGPESSDDDEFALADAAALEIVHNFLTTSKAHRPQAGMRESNLEDMD